MKAVSAWEVSVTRRLPLILAIPILISVGAAQAGAQTRYAPPAQSVGLELQAGGGYVHDSGEGPSQGAVEVGAVFWLTSHTGVGSSFVKGIGDDHFQPPEHAGDRIFLGPGGLRQTTFTVQFRGVDELGLEWNFGIGIGSVSYEYQQILTGIRRANGEIDPVTPTLLRDRSGVESIPIEVLAGHHIRGPLGVKAGFTYHLTGDMHPFNARLLASVSFR
jgi:hypothetical protein